MSPNQLLIATSKGCVGASKYVKLLQRTTFYIPFLDASFLELYLKHFNHSILQQAHVVINQHSLVDSTAFAHQANQRKMAAIVSIKSESVGEDGKNLLRDLSCVDVGVSSPFERDNAFSDAFVIGVGATDRLRSRAATGL